MRSAELRELLDKLKEGALSVEEVVDSLGGVTDGGDDEIARIDHSREERTGAPEIVYGESKTAEQIAAIMTALDRDGAGALATRVSAEKAQQVLSLMGEGEYYDLSRILLRHPSRQRRLGLGVIGVVCAGTSDLPVAEEAIVSLRFLGQEVCSIADVGVAGLHRLQAVLPSLRRCEVLVVVAGMEGALPTVVAGLVDRPIVAVPTSVGYGVSFGGFAALVGMLSSCAPGVSVVNIDNGLGAALAATRINQRRNAS